MNYKVRYIASGEEIPAVIKTMRAWFIPPIAADNPILENMADYYPAYKNMMIVAEKAGQIVGGALGYGSNLCIIAVRPEDRMKGLGRRLLQTFEVGAMKRGVTMVSLGARKEAKGFYEQVGYSGKSSMHKGLPLPSKSLDWRLRKMDSVIGNLDKGQELDLDESGRISPLVVKL